MIRRPHILRPIRSKRKYRNFLFFDVESNIVREDDNTEVHTLRLGAYRFLSLDRNRNIIYSEEKTFTTSEQFAETVERLSNRHFAIQLVAHNVGYDLQVSCLLPQLIERGWELVKVYAKNRTVIIRLKKGKRNITIVDGLNRLQGSIEQLGKLVGLPKLSVDFASVTDKELEQYCKRDVEILSVSTLEFLRFLDSIDAGKDCLTIASQAFSLYRRHFMRYKIYVHNNEEVLQMEREAYRGGLVRCWAYGEFNDDTYYALDVNSMYPYVMLTYKYPCKLLKVERNVSISRLKELVSVACVVADVTFTPPKPYFSTFHKGIRVYTTNRMRCCLTTPEIVYLLEHNAIHRVHRVAIYKAKPLFQEYVTFFYELRKRFKETGNTIYAEICKLFLNSLYGKFGSYATSFKRAPDFDGENLADMGLRMPGDKHARQVFYIGDTCYMETPEGETYDSFPAIAAHVTAYARMYLLSLVEQAGEENVYYTDTDSLIVNEKGYLALQNVIDGTKLGHLKVEEVGTSLIVAGRKAYAIGNRRKLKGITRKYIGENLQGRIKEQWQGLMPYLKSSLTKPMTITRKTLRLRFPLYDGIPNEKGIVIPYHDVPNKFPTLLEVMPNLSIFAPTDFAK